MIRKPWVSSARCPCAGRCPFAGHRALRTHGVRIGALVRRLAAPLPLAIGDSEATGTQQIQGTQKGDPLSMHLLSLVIQSIMMIGEIQANCALNLEV